MTRGVLNGATVLSLESRHGAEMARLIEKLGGRALRAPSMREVPLSDQVHAQRFADTLVAGECDVLVLLTGVGLSSLLSSMEHKYPREQLLASLGRVQLACRGPKPARVLKSLGLEPTLVAPEPNTSKELLHSIEHELDLRGRRVFLQEYGAENPELMRQLVALGATVTAVPVYAWQLPEDCSGLESAVQALLERRVDIALFTSARQLDHLLQVAGNERQAIIDALSSTVFVGSVGPVTSDALRAVGVTPDAEPRHPKMGQLVTHTAAVWSSRSPR